MNGTIAETACGWLALYGESGVVHGLSIGFDSDEAALASLGQSSIDDLEPSEWAGVVDAICDYLVGESFALSEIPYVEPNGLTQFQSRVRQIVAAIPYGECRTYGEVAALAGHPRAARAVGSVMSSNTIPLLMPCHRVVPAGGKLGGYTGPGGIGLKEKLLALEAEKAALVST